MQPVPPVYFEFGKPISTTISTLGNTTSVPAGSGFVYLVSEFPGACNVLGPKAVMLGVPVSWNAVSGD